MVVIGLTGGIGSGKSIASQYLKKQGCIIIDADAVSRSLTKPESSLLPVLANVFGAEILTEDGALDRKKLAAIVFQDTRKRRQLDELMHQQILRKIKDEVEEQRRRGDVQLVFIDAPLLFEAGLDKDCDSVWLITADEKTRIARVCQRDDMTEEEVRARMAHQLPDQEKAKKADVVIENDGSPSDLFGKLEKLLETALKKPDFY